MDDFLQQLKKMHDQLQEATKTITPVIALVNPQDIDEIVTMLTDGGLLHRREYFLNAQEKHVIYSDYGIATVVYAYIFLSSTVERGQMALFETSAGMTAFTGRVQVGDRAWDALRRVRGE